MPAGSMGNKKDRAEEINVCDPAAGGSSAAGSACADTDTGGTGIRLSRDWLNNTGVIKPLWRSVVSA